MLPYACFTVGGCRVVYVNLNDAKASAAASLFCAGVDTALVSYTFGALDGIQRYCAVSHLPPSSTAPDVETVQREVSVATADAGAENSYNRTDYNTASGGADCDSEELSSRAPELAVRGPISLRQIENDFPEGATGNVYGCIEWQAF